MTPKAKLMSRRLRASLLAVVLTISVVPSWDAKASEDPEIGLGPNASSVAAQPVPANPWGYNFDCCTLITNPPTDFCTYFPCIASFATGTGYVVECADGNYSRSGGVTGVCSTHGGFGRNLYDPARAVAACDVTGAATSSAYLPNITKTLGGPGGFYTPFIVQNVGTATTDLQVSFYRFSDGSLVTCRKILGLRPGTSFADVPNNDLDLPDNSQFSVVVRSFGSQIVAVVNEHAGAGDLAEALSYNGFAAGSTTVYLPNIVRRFFGYHTPFIIQNLGTATTVATATFVGRANEPGATIVRTVAAGRSQFIEPNIEPSLIDGGAYAVTLRADQPLAVVVNTHNDDPPIRHPVAYATDGISAGAGAVYGAYAVKNANNYGRAGTMSTIVVQNLGAAATAPTLEFTPLGGGPTTTFAGPSTAPGGAWAFDPRYVNGLAGGDFCPVVPSAGCLANGEFTFKGTAAGTIAAAVNVISPDSAMGYTATNLPATKYFLPNVTRTLGGPSGWTTPILLLSVNATGASVEWRRFTDGALVTTQNLALTAGVGIRIDPLAVGGLSNDTQYAVTVTAVGGQVVAIVEELATGGDNAMIYEGFAAP